MKLKKLFDEYVFNFPLVEVFIQLAFTVVIITLLAFVLLGESMSGFLGFERVFTTSFEIYVAGSIVLVFLLLSFYIWYYCLKGYFQFFSLFFFFAVFTINNEYWYVISRFIGFGIFFHIIYKTNLIEKLDTI